MKKDKVMSSIFSEENLYTFSVVAKLASFSKAAEELGVTASAVSYTIKRLETYLGNPLFVRSTRSVELTETGIYFYRKANDLLNEFREIERSLISIDKGIEAKIKICINNILHTPHHTARLVGFLKNQFPSCQVVISTEVYNGVWDALINKDADLALGAPGTLLDGGGIDYVEIGYVHWKFVVPESHSLALLPEPVPESILRSYPAICVEDTADSILKKVAWLLHGQEAIKVPDLETKYWLQLFGTGIGFIPDYMAQGDLINHTFVEKKIQNPRQPSKMLLATKHSRKGEVIQWIKQEFKQGGVLSQLYQDMLRE